MKKILCMIVTVMLVMTAMCFVPVAAADTVDAKIDVSLYDINITVKTDKLTLTAKDGASYIVANGRYLFTNTPIYMKNGRMYAPVLLMAKAFDIIKYL